MSFFTLVPNSIPNVLRSHNQTQFQPQSNIQARILLLSTALRTSIISYQKHLILANQANIGQKVSNVQGNINITKKQRIEAGFKIQDKQQTHLSKVTQKAVIQQKIMPPSIKNINPPTAVSPKTLDQFNFAKLQVVNGANKAKNIKELKQSSKLIPRDAKDIAIPTVDLNDSAYLPRIGLSRQALVALRYKLQKRKVEEWKGNDKDRKDRRELRMLSI